MNREELEKEIREIADYLSCNDDELVSEIMKLIPEVLKSVIHWTESYVNRWNRKIYLDVNTFIYDMEQKVKELFWIDL